MNRVIAKHLVSKTVLIIIYRHTIRLKYIETVAFFILLLPISVDYIDICCCPCDHLRNVTKYFVMTIRTAVSTGLSPMVNAFHMIIKKMIVNPPY
jgi:hypothetical protein